MQAEQCLFGITPFAQKTREDTWLTIIVGQPHDSILQALD